MKDEITVADDLLFDTADKLKRLDEADVADDRERTRRELAIYHGYFDTLSKVVQNPHADGKNETARAFVGRHIHPGYLIMQFAIPAYTNNAAIIPTKERIDFFSAFDELMLVIGARWNDTANAALNVRACFDDVSDKIATLDNVRAMTKQAAAQFAADMDGLHQRLRQRLIELSAVLMNAPECDTSEKDEILDAIQDVAHKADEHHKELLDSDERTQNMVHQKFEELEPTKNGVQLLVDRALIRSKKAREAQAKAAGDEAKKKAAADMARALEKVRNDPGVKAGERSALKNACVRVCDEFEGLGRKLSNGKFSLYAPLMDWQMRPIKWESLRRAYNKKYGSVRKAKSGVKSKPQTVTKSKPKRVTK